MKRSEQKISVIIPTLNRCHSLPRAIDSVLKQTLIPDELIVVDNGSSDGSLEMIGSKYPSVQLLKEEKLGVSAARNKGIKESNGNWVALLDSDDEWLPQKLQRQIEVVTESDGNSCLVHTNEVWKKNNSFVNQMKKHKKSGGDIFNSCLRLCCISPSSSLLNKRLFFEIGYFDENLPACEDYDLWLRICSKEKVLFVDEPLLIKNGGHHDQLSQKYWGMDRFRVYSLERLLCSGELTVGNQECAYEVLMNKILVLIKGGMKRGNGSLVKFYSKKRDFWIGKKISLQDKQDQSYKKLDMELDYYRD